MAGPYPASASRIVDYDDGDPYSCIAAGYAEQQRAARSASVKSQVAACFEGPPEQLQKLVRENPGGVKVALYDLWHYGRLIKSCRPKGEWAARQMALLGDPSWLEYDQKVPPPE